jgi:signal transduction histidine kinase
LKYYFENHTKSRFKAKIIDTGIGISEEFFPRLFEPFAQEEQGYTRRYEGNGLGLALVKKYCDLSNVKIKVESSKGIGTTFSLLFEKSKKSV